MLGQMARSPTQININNYGQTKTLILLTANTGKNQFFRPPFIQFIECEDVKIEGLTIKNSPFWTVNPVGCNNVVVSGATILNPEDGHNTDGINPSIVQ